MKKTLVALCFVALFASYSNAGVFRKRSAVCVSGQCQTQTPAKVESKTVTTTQTTTTTSTSTAQGVANLIVVTGRFRHFGGYSGFEGIGMGSTPAIAEANCCYRGRWAPRERAFAQMSNGMWVCVCRY